MTMPGLRIIISKVLWLLVLAALPFYLFPAATRWQGLLFLPVAGLLAVWVLRKPIPGTPLNPAVLLLVLMTLISGWVTSDLVTSLQKIAGVVAAVAVYFTVAAYSQHLKTFPFTVMALVVCGVGVSLLGLVGMFWSEALTGKVSFLQPVIDKFPLLITGLPGAEKGLHPNEVAGTLLWILLPTLGWLLSLLVRRDASIEGQRQAFLKGVTRILLAAVLLVCCSLFFFAFVFTQSRSSYIGLAIATGLCLLLSFTGRARRILLAVSLGVVIALVILVFPFLPVLLSLFAKSDPGVVDPFLSTQTFFARIGIWTYGVSLLRDSPIFGIGMNIFRSVVFFHFPFQCTEAVCDIGHAHNEFLQVGLDLGIPGMIAFLSLNLGAFWMLFRLYQKADDGEARDFPLKLIVLGLAGGLFSHFIYGLFDAIALGAKPGFLFWMLIGLIAGLYQQHKPHLLEEHHHAN